MRKSKKRTLQATAALKEKREAAAFETELLEILPEEDDLSREGPENKKPKIGRPTKSYREQVFKDKIRKKAWDRLVSFTDGSVQDVHKLVLDLLKSYLPEFYDSLTAFDTLSQNLSEAFHVFTDEIRGSSFGAEFAAVTTQNLTLEKSVELTHYSKRSIGRGRKNLKERIPTCEWLYLQS